MSFLMAGAITEGWPTMGTLHPMSPRVLMRRPSRPVAADQGMSTSAPAALALFISSVRSVLLGSTSVLKTGFTPAFSSSSAAVFALDVPYPVVSPMIATLDFFSTLSA
ncbi:MAG TPA: hypothetical protein PKW35_25310 [Nannocystaceae bacterium]|nr:hypothetical protein [Nannocystaceae bacterium]